MIYNYAKPKIYANDAARAKSDKLIQVQSISNKYVRRMYRLALKEDHPFQQIFSS